MALLGARLRTTIHGMASKKPAKVDRHKPSRMVRIPERVAQLLEECAAEDFDTLTDQVRAACVSRLIERGKLPKPGRQLAD
jgi:hypothetical protein